MARVGRQTPTTWIKQPYTETKAEQDIAAYEQTGRKLLEWQRLQIEAITAVDADGLWVHMTYGYEVPRRNGKGEVIMARELGGLVRGERICHTAHQTSTSHSAFERLYNALIAAGYVEVTRKKKDKPANSFRAAKQYGLEEIELTIGGRITFRTRTNSGGLGEGFDLLVIDEAQEYTSKQESALQYTVTDSENPQTILCGTPPTAVSRGDVFGNLRKAVLDGKEATGWAEWSIDHQTDQENVDAWYETNPSLGLRLKERNIRQEIKPGEAVDFNIQRLGLWLSYSLQSAISAADWARLQADAVPELMPERYFGVKYGQDGRHVALAVAAQTTDGRIFVEAIDCRSIREPDTWLTRYLTNPHAAAWAVDGQGQADILIADARAAGCRIRAAKPTVAEVIEGNAIFERRLFAGDLVHMGQQSLAQIVTNCEHRPIGSHGGFGYRSINEHYDAALMDAVVLAQWLAGIGKRRRKQKIQL